MGGLMGASEKRMRLLGAGEGRDEMLLVESVRSTVELMLIKNAQRRVTEQKRRVGEKKQKNAEQKTGDEERSLARRPSKPRTPWAARTFGQPAEHGVSLD